LLAARMIEAGLGEGVHFALPTMATANAMHERLGEIAQRLFADDPEARAPSVILSHGKAEIAETLARPTGRPSGDAEDTTAASYNDWIADDRRRAFFADVGAGTIDQAFLAILPKKHLTLRHWLAAFSSSTRHIVPRSNVDLLKRSRTAKVANPECLLRPRHCQSKLAVMRFRLGSPPWAGGWSARRANGA
jgi:hypothetical protein